MKNFEDYKAALMNTSSEHIREKLLAQAEDMEDIITIGRFSGGGSLADLAVCGEFGA